jgi:hypothetical protein
LGTRDSSGFDERRSLAQEKRERRLTLRVRDVDVGAELREQVILRDLVVGRRDAKNVRPADDDLRLGRVSANESNQIDDRLRLDVKRRGDGDRARRLRQKLAEARRVVARQVDELARKAALAEEARQIADGEVRLVKRVEVGAPAGRGRNGTIQQVDVVMAVTVEQDRVQLDVGVVSR